MSTNGLFGPVLLDFREVGLKPPVDKVEDASRRVAAAIDWNGRLAPLLTKETP